MDDRSGSGDGLRRLRRAYSSVALALLNGVVAFTAVNALLAGRPFGERLSPGFTPAEQLAASLAIEYEPYTSFRPRPVHDASLNVAPAGYRLVNLQGPWPPAPDACSVFVFGGATVFGLGGPDDAALASLIGDRLSADRAQPVHVYNFGRPGYVSTQERLLLERLLASGHVARLHIFIDGPGEFVLWPRPLTADIMRHALETGADGTPLATRAADWLWGLPGGRAALALAGTRPAWLGRAPGPPEAVSVMRAWLANKRIVDELMAEFGSRALFAWLPVESWPAAARDSSAEPAGAPTPAGGDPMDRWRRERSSDPTVLWLGDVQPRLREDAGAARDASAWAEFARRIAEHVEAQGLLDCRGPQA